MHLFGWLSHIYKHKLYICHPLTGLKKVLRPRTGRALRLAELHSPAARSAKTTGTHGD